MQVCTGWSLHTCEWRGLARAGRPAIRRLARMGVDGALKRPTPQLRRVVDSMGCCSSTASPSTPREGNRPDDTARGRPGVSAQSVAACSPLAAGGATIAHVDRPSGGAARLIAEDFSPDRLGLSSVAAGRRPPSGICGDQLASTGLAGRPERGSPACGTARRSAVRVVSRFHSCQQTCSMPCLR